MFCFKYQQTTFELHFSSREQYPEVEALCQVFTYLLCFFSARSLDFKSLLGVIRKWSIIQLYFFIHKNVLLLVKDWMLLNNQGNTATHQYHLISISASILGALAAILFCFGTPPTHNTAGATILCCHGARTSARAPMPVVFQILKIFLRLQCEAFNGHHLAP